MKKTSVLTLAMVMLLALAAPMIARADVQDRLFDFTDDYYRQNGVDPAQIVNRRQGVAPRGII
ncbi:MAG TPA: hypothetical protein VGO68_21035, partial [Pyrinomonadaceae bacterium]|nr:hypothetical protein [Pyrinomonadaceae bacterium]